MIPLAPALAYRRSATQFASAVGLVIALYDTLARDLYRAIDAMRQNDLEARAQHLKHGFSVLTQLDGLLDIEHGGATATQLRHFYAHLRGEMLRAQFSKDVTVLEQATNHLFEVRDAWQQLDLRTQQNVGAQALAVSPSPEPLRVEA